jgi:hypothetical protein
MATDAFYQVIMPNGCGSREKERFICIYQKKVVILQANLQRRLNRKINMVREMTLHQAKMNLLRVVDGIKTVDEVQAIQQLLANYYAQKAQAELDRLWDEGVINEQVIELWGQEHMRTPYRYAK